MASSRLGQCFGRPKQHSSRVIPSAVRKSCLFFLRHYLLFPFFLLVFVLPYHRLIYLLVLLVNVCFGLLPLCFVILHVFQDLFMRSFKRAATFQVATKRLRLAKSGRMMNQMIRTFTFHGKFGNCSASSNTINATALIVSTITFR